MHYESFVDYLGYHDCKLVPEKSHNLLEVYRSGSRPDRIANIYRETWIRPLHVIGVCRDLDIDIPGELSNYEAEFDAKFPLL